MSDPTSIELPPVAYLSQLIGNTGYVHAILVAANLGLADLLKNGPLSIDDLAEATGTHAGSLYRMLRALASRGSRVLLVEMVIPAGNAPSPGKFLDLEMLLYFYSRERTEAEYRDLLQQAGLELITITPTASPFSIIEAAPA